MIISKIHLPRRTFLRGMGVAVALPFLDSMVPAQTPLAKTAANPRIRLGYCYIPHGGVMANWTPAAEGSNRRVFAHFDAVAAFPRPGGGGQQSRAQAGGRARPRR